MSRHSNRKKLGEAVVISERVQKAVCFAIESGYQLDKGAFDFLETISQKGDPVQLIEEAMKKVGALPEKPLFIERSVLEEATKRIFPEKEEVKTPLPQPMLQARKVAFRAYAKDVNTHVKVIEDPTDNICTTGSMEEYLEYFQDRFKRIERLLRKRRDTRDATTISEALRAPVNSKMKIIGMIIEKRERKQRVFLRVDDLEASATVLLPPKVMEKAQKVLLDQVVCISVIKGRNDLLIAEDFLLPDVPQKTPQKASIPVYAALISDLHVGSKMFLHEALHQFVLWLNGRLGNKNFREIAGHVKYVVIAGDLVDGIGIYPEQMKELAIKDIYKQYQAMAKFAEEIPDYIELIIIPGNHDASRKALPQPAISRDYAEPLYEARKLFSLGNPATVNLHGVELLLYHGRSLDDVVGAASNVSFHSPDKAMRLLLQSRHLAPTYGQKTPIAPERRDFLVIERVPDIFHTGHVHVLKYDTYRGTLMLNSGAMQSQTEYQRKMGLKPTPGIVPIVNLQTLRVTPISFPISSA